MAKPVVQNVEAVVQLMAVFIYFNGRAKIVHPNQSCVKICSHRTFIKLMNLRAND